MDVSKAVPVMTFGETYKRASKCCEAVEQLHMGRFKMEESEGYVALQSIKHEKHLSRLSQHPPMAYQDARRAAVRLPRVRVLLEEELPMGEQVVVLGGRDMWRLESESGKVGLDDAIWRPAPRNLRALTSTTCFSEDGSENRFTVGHDTTQALENMIRKVAGGEKYRLLMSGLSGATQKQYFRFWARWATSQHWRGKTPWLNPQLDGWGEDLIDWILYGNKVVGISASTIQGSISALRNMHLIFGKADFAKSGNRRNRLLKAIKLKTASKAKTPFRFEFVQELSELSKDPLCEKI